MYQFSLKKAIPIWISVVEPSYYIFQHNTAVQYLFLSQMKRQRTQTDTEAQEPQVESGIFIWFLIILLNVSAYLFSINSERYGPQNLGQITNITGLHKQFAHWCYFNEWMNPGTTRAQSCYELEVARTSASWSAIKQVFQRGLKGYCPRKKLCSRIHTFNLFYRLVQAVIFGH